MHRRACGCCRQLCAGAAQCMCATANPGLLSSSPRQTPSRAFSSYGRRQQTVTGTPARSIHLSPASLRKCRFGSLQARSDAKESTEPDKSQWGWPETRRGHYGVCSDMESRSFLSSLGCRKPLLEEACLRECCSAQLSESDILDQILET